MTKPVACAIASSKGRAHFTDDAEMLRASFEGRRLPRLQLPDTRRLDSYLTHDARVTLIPPNKGSLRKAFDD